MAGRRLLLVVLLWLKIGALHVLDRFSSKLAWSITEGHNKASQSNFPRLTTSGMPFVLNFCAGISFFDVITEKNIDNEDYGSNFSRL